jgi:hypothetical protein
MDDAQIYNSFTELYCSVSHSESDIHCYIISRKLVSTIFNGRRGEFSIQYRVIFSNPWCKLNSDSEKAQWCKLKNDSEEVQMIS